MTQFRSKLHQMTVEFPTDYWNDSCSEEELSYAISHGAVGATSNPTIVHTVLKKEMHLWHERIQALIRDNPGWSEAEITWKLFEEAATEVARTLALAIVEDGEGATKFITVEVEGGLTEAECEQVGFAIARSPLVKTAFFACDPDLEGELVRALGTDRMLALVEERGQLHAFRVYQKQPDKRGRPLEAQLHGWLHNWKVRYAAALVDALELERVPPPLDGVLARV